MRRRHREASSFASEELTVDRAQVYAAGSEDMDTLTFNSPIVLRHLTFSEARKTPIDVISLPNVLAGLELTMDEVRRPPSSLSPLFALTNQTT